MNKRRVIKPLLVLAIIGAMLWVVAYSAGVTPPQQHARIMLAELNQQDGVAFQEAFAAQPGVRRLMNGVLVEVLHKGDGVSPKVDDWVKVHYRGQFIDGRRFDDTWQRQEPATLPIQEAIKGWQTVLPSMQVGDRVKLVIPPALAYGRGGSGPVGPEETLIFEIELLEVLEESSAMISAVIKSS